ncbi:hypothetical protein E0500_017500 [Streptomyces sp. KM273126]|uniref:hypothetical protein n=1 Tax=Streptomyces sp. KM273126 TaxID=2545247 RepID=UPI00103BA58C|nr:hypothetical protein [Streptomyces sp. KM273126]MBA2809143.1 hypothetical protein [Streptomyces sp. KM273126]
MEPEEIIGALVVLVKAAERAAPHLKRWWNYQARPFVKSTRTRFVRTRKADSQAITTESSTLIESVSSDASQELVAALEGHRATLMLEVNPSLLDEENLAEIGKILGGSRGSRAPAIEERNGKKDYV